MHEAEPGAMLAVSLGVEDVRPFLTAELWIAAENSPRLTVLAGTTAAVKELARHLEEARAGRSTAGDGPSLSYAVDGAGGNTLPGCSGRSAAHSTADAVALQCDRHVDHGATGSEP